MFLSTVHSVQAIARYGIFSVHSYRSTVTSPQLSVTSSPVYQFTSSLVHHSRLTTNFSLRPSRVLDTMALVYRHKPITRTDRNYSPFTNHHSLLNQSTGSPLTTHDSLVTNHQNPLHYFTTHDTCHFEPACVPWKAGDFR